MDTEDEIPVVEVAITATLTDIDDIEQTSKAAIELFTLYNGTRSDDNAKDKFILVDDYDGFIPDIDVSLLVDEVLGGWKRFTRVNFCTGKIITVFRNTFDVAQEFKVKLYPYDTQTLNYTFVSSNSILVTWKSDSTYVKDYNRDFVENVRDWDVDDVNFFRSVAPNWRLEGIDLHERDTGEDDNYLYPGKLSLDLIMKRDPAYYSLNYILIIYVTVATNLSVAGVPVDDISGRMSIVVTLLLTLVALKLVLTDVMPRSPTPTYIDVVIFSGFLIMFLIVLEIVTLRLIDIGLLIDEEDLEEISQYGEISVEDQEIAIARADLTFHFLMFFIWTTICTFHSCGGILCGPFIYSLGKCMKLKENPKYIGYHPGTDKKPTKLQKYYTAAGKALKGTKELAISATSKENRNNAILKLKGTFKKLTDSVKEDV